jgi:hypothetical protein
MGIPEWNLLLRQIQRQQAKWGRSLVLAQWQQAQRIIQANNNSQRRP